jgi:hypothetical protein
VDRKVVKLYVKDFEKIVSFESGGNCWGFNVREIGTVCVCAKWKIKKKNLLSVAESKRAEKGEKRV